MVIETMKKIGRTRASSFVAPLPIGDALPHSTGKIWLASVYYLRAWRRQATLASAVLDLSKRITSSDNQPWRKVMNGRPPTG